MATAPAVQSLDQIIASLNPAYQASTDVINNQIAAVPAKYDAQRTALTGAKVQGFNDINNSATGRGLSFSGIPINEQANYLSTKYLPGIQAADASQNADQLSLTGSLADLNKQKLLQAQQMRDTQQSTLDQYLQQQAQNEFTSQQAALDRAATAANTRYTADAGAKAKAYTTKADSSGGTGFFDPNGQPVTAAQYFNATGDGLKGLLSFLANDPNSQAAYQAAQQPGVTIEDLQKQFPYIFAGA